MTRRCLIFILYLVMGTILLTGCLKSKQITEINLSTEIESETITNALDRDQSVYFNCISTEGISAYSMTKVLYEQPEIKNNVIFEYSIYNDRDLIYEALENDKINIGIFPFKLAADILNDYDHYRMVGVVKAENHVLLGVSNLLDLKGKEIIVFDPSGFDGQFMTTLNRLNYELGKINVYFGKDYTYKTVQSIDETKEINENQVILVEAKAIELDMYESFRISENYFEIDESNDYQLALLAEDSIIEIYPEIVSDFVDVYQLSCLWLSAYPDRAQAYASQLNLTDLLFNEKSFYYFDAQKSTKTIKNLLTVCGYNDLENQKILNLIH